MPKSSPSQLKASATWRKRKQDAGLVAFTVWIKPENKVFFQRLERMISSCPDSASFASLFNLTN